MPYMHVYHWKLFFKVHDYVLLGFWPEILYWKRYSQKISVFVTGMFWNSITTKLVEELFLTALGKYKNMLLSTTRTQDVKWMYMRLSEDVSGPFLNALCTFNLRLMPSSKDLDQKTFLMLLVKMKIITLVRKNIKTSTNLSNAIKYSANERLKLQYCIKLVILLIFKKYTFINIAKSHKLDNVWLILGL